MEEMAKALYRRMPGLDGTHGEVCRCLITPQSDGRSGVDVFRVAFDAGRDEQTAAASVVKMYQMVDESIYGDEIRKLKSCHEGLKNGLFSIDFTNLGRINGWCDAGFSIGGAARERSRFRVPPPAGTASDLAGVYVIAVRDAPEEATVKLSEFIRENHKGIVTEWEAFARSLLPAAGGMSATALRDHAEEILEAIVEDLESPQGGGEQSRKSKGEGDERRMEAVGSAHAVLRLQDGFRLSQLVAEYRALRASVLRLFERAGGTDMRQVTRFNESIDEALAEATDRYMLVIDRTRDQFLAMLGHDLRNPLSAISMSTGLLTSARGADDRTIKIAARILRSAGRMQRMVNDLLDLTRTRLGRGIPIAPRPMDFEELSREVLAEFEAFHPNRRFDFRSEGDLQGVWDSDRLAQVISNLVGNAIQHGDPDQPIELVAREDAEEVVIEVHNEGPTIPRALLANIFEPMVRDAARPEEQASRSLGLGLHIVREIVIAHGGTVTVTSTDGAGTTFSVRLPRRSTAASPPPAEDEPPDVHDATGRIVVP